MKLQKTYRLKGLKCNQKEEMRGADSNSPIVKYAKLLFSSTIHTQITDFQRTVFRGHLYSKNNLILSLIMRVYANLALLPLRTPMRL